MQCHAIDETAHQRLAAGPQQFRPDMQIIRQRQRVALAREQGARREIGPPWHLIEPTQHRIDLACLAAKAAAFDRGEHVALQQDAFGPSRRQCRGVVFRQTHEMLTPPLQSAGCRLSSDRDRTMRER
jgi:hypothetical protein